MNTPQASPDLASLRVQIDSIDQQLLTLLNQRALVAEQVGEVKKREGTPFFRPDRVAQVIDKITHANPGRLEGPHVAAIWREIMSACLALESPQRVAVLGPMGTFCEQAALEYFGGAADMTYCANFDEPASRRFLVSTYPRCHHWTQPGVHLRDRNMKFHCFERQRRLLMTDPISGVRDRIGQRLTTGPGMADS
eukprot:gene41914-55614_t